MGIDSISRANFQRDYLWEVLLPPLAGFDTSQVLQLETLIQSVRFGDYSVDSPSMMRVGPYQSWFVGLLSVQTIKMTFLKTNPDLVAPYFYAWRQLMVDNTGLFQPKSNYQKNIYIRFLDTDGTASGQYKCVGCFPTTFPQYNLDYGSNKIVQIEPIFNVDKIEYTDTLD